MNRSVINQTFSRMSKPVIEYKPYRGECEPVTEITVAKLILHPANLEIMCFYKFKELLDSGYDQVNQVIIPRELRDNFVKCHLILKKSELEICRTVRVHDFDKTQEECPLIEITSFKNRFNILCKNEEADSIMKSLKSWILG